MENNPFANSSKSNHAHEPGFDHHTNFCPSATPPIIRTMSAQELYTSQILYEPSSWAHLMSNLSFNDNDVIRAPSPGLNLHNTRQHQTPPFPIPPTIPNPIPGYNSSHQNHPSSQTTLTDTITHFHNLANAQQYYKTHCPSSSTVNSLDETRNIFHNINLTEITNNELNKNKQPATAPPPPYQNNNTDVKVDSDGVDDDGQIRSLPHKKNGPYTCSKCKQEFLTSQQFAAHVSAKHYKYETKAERSKRLMAKVRRRNLRLAKVNNQLTCLPVSSSETRAIAGNRSALRFEGGKESFAVKVEIDEQVGLQNQVTPPPGKEAKDNVKIKEEPYA